MQPHPAANPHVCLAQGSCGTIQSRTYNNFSYPAENCPLPGLHNGRDMYYWSGSIDDCPGNQLHLDTGGGNCYDTVWGGMSGSGMYYISDGNRYVHAVCSKQELLQWQRRHTASVAQWLMFRCRFRAS